MHMLAVEGLASATMPGSRLQSAVEAGLLTSHLLPGADPALQEEDLTMLSRPEALAAIKVLLLALADPPRQAKAQQQALLRQLAAARELVDTLGACTESFTRDEAKVQQWVAAGKNAVASSSASPPGEAAEGDFSAARLLQQWTALRRKGALSEQECRQLGLLTYTRRLQARCGALQSESSLHASAAGAARETASRLRSNLHDALAAMQQVQAQAAAREEQLQQGQQNMQQLHVALRQLQREHGANTAHLSAQHSKHMAAAGVSVASSSAASAGVLSRCTVLQQGAVALRGEVQAMKRATSRALQDCAAQAAQDAHKLQRAMRQLQTQADEARSAQQAAADAHSAALAKASLWQERHSAAARVASAATAASQEQNTLMLQAQAELESTISELSSTRTALTASLQDAAEARKQSKQDRAALQQAQMQVKANLQRIAVLERGIGAARQEAAAAEKRCREALLAAKDARAQITAKAAAASAQYSKLQQDCARHRGHAATLQMQLDRFKNSGAGQRRLAASARLTTEAGCQVDAEELGPDSLQQAEAGQVLQEQLQESESAQAALRQQLLEALAARDGLQQQVKNAASGAQSALAVLQSTKGSVLSACTKAHTTAPAASGLPTATGDGTVKVPAEAQAPHEIQPAPSTAAGSGSSSQPQELRSQLHLASVQAQAAIARCAQVQAAAGAAIRQAQEAAAAQSVHCQQLQARLDDIAAGEGGSAEAGAGGSPVHRSQMPTHPASPVLGSVPRAFLDIEVQTSLQATEVDDDHVATSFARGASDGSLTPRSRPDRSAEWQRRRQVADSQARQAMEHTQAEAQARRERRAAQIIGAFIAGCGASAGNGGGMWLAVTGVLARRRLAERIKNMRRRVSAEKVQQLLNSTAADKRSMGLTARPVSPRDAPADGSFGRPRGARGAGSTSPLARSGGSPGGALLSKAD